MVLEDRNTIDKKIVVHGKDAFGEVYDYYFPRIYNFIYARVGNRDDADEIVSVVFEKAFSRLDTYNSQYASFSTWLYAIAKNTIRNFFRVKKIRTFVDIDDHIEKLQDNTNDMDHKMVQNETNDHLMKALNKLGDREKEVVSLKFWGALSNKEIAKVTGLGNSNVGVILHRSVNKLRNHMTESEDDKESFEK